MSKSILMWKFYQLQLLKGQVEQFSFYKFKAEFKSDETHKPKQVFYYRLTWSGVSTSL